MSERLIRSAVRRALYDAHMVLPDGTGAADLLSEILQRLDVELSSRASEATAASIASRLDVNLSTRASEETLQSILSKLQPLSFDQNGYVYVNIGADSAGLARDSTVSEILQRLNVDILASQTVTLDNSTSSTTATMPVFANDVQIPSAGIATIQMYLDHSVTVKLRIVRGGSTLEAYINGGNSLAANSWYEFAVTLLGGDAVNILVDVPAGTVVNGYAAILLRRR